MRPATCTTARSSSEPAARAAAARVVHRHTCHGTSLHDAAAAHAGFAAPASRRAPAQHSRHTALIPRAKGFGAASGSRKTGGGGVAAGKQCPCGSGKPLSACCGRYHAPGGPPAPTPEALLRARFSAYALQLVDFLVATTHKENPEHTGDPLTYARSVQRTARSTEFLALTILGDPGAGGGASSSSGGASSSGAASGSSSELQAPAAAGAAAGAGSAAGGSSSSSGQQAAAVAAGAGPDDAFLRFQVRWRPRGGAAAAGGGEELATETSHFRRVGGRWLYYRAAA